MTDQQGEIVWASEYKAWGNVLRVVQAAPKRRSLVAVEVEAEAEAAAANDVAEFQPIRFLGQYHDTETGLNYNRFRYYDADCGRYVSVDPIGLGGGSNSYQYAPNPSGWTDPLGLAKSCHCDEGGTKVASEKELEELAKLRISERHFLRSLSVAKENNSLFLGSRESALIDIMEIGSNRAIRNGENFTTSSGRVWGTHNKSLHQISGPDIVPLNRQQYSLLSDARKLGAEKVMKSVDKIAERGVLSAEEVSEVKRIMKLMEGNKID